MKYNSQCQEFARLVQDTRNQASRELFRACDEYSSSCDSGLWFRAGKPQFQLTQTQDSQAAPEPPLPQKWGVMVFFFSLLFPKMPTLFPAVVTSTHQVTNVKAVPVTRQVSGRSHPKTCQRDQLSPARPTTPKGQTTNALEPTMLHHHTTPRASQHVTRGHNIRPVNAPEISPRDPFRPSGWPPAVAGTLLLPLFVINAGIRYQLLDNRPVSRTSLESEYHFHTYDNLPHLAKFFPKYLFFPKKHTPTCLNFFPTSKKLSFLSKIK